MLKIYIREIVSSVTTIQLQIGIYTKEKVSISYALTEKVRISYALTEKGKVKEIQVNDKVYLCLKKLYMSKLS